MESVPAAIIGLEDIPNEILIQVFKCLALDRATLRCLVTTSKRISPLAIQILAHAIDVYVQTENSALSRKYDALMASLNRVPELGVSTRKIIIRCETRGQKTKRSEHPNVRANILLRRLPKIRSLSIDWHNQQYTFAPAFLERKECCLEEVEFLGGKTSLNQIGAFKTTASLSRIAARNLNSASKLSPHLLYPDPAQRDSPKLKIMDLGRAHFPDTELRRLFELFPFITTVDCGVPRDENSWNFHNFIPLPEGLIAQAFAPLRDGLVNLRLRGGPVPLTGGPNFGPMDLTELSHLKVLHVTSTCYFHGFPQFPQRTGLRPLLPPSLEEFKVWFDFGNHFLYMKDELPQCFPDGQYNDCIEVEHPERYHWLVELIGANLTDPNYRLRKVLIEERLFNSEFTYYHSHLWKLPSALDQLCSDAGVTLEVHIRKPMGLDDLLPDIP